MRRSLFLTTACATTVAMMIPATAPTATVASNAGPRIIAPGSVRPGQRVVIRLENYEPYSRVLFGAQDATFIGSNSGGSTIGRRLGYHVRADGSLAIHVRWPSGYFIHCTTPTHCGRRQSWSTRAFLTAADDTGNQYTHRWVRVRP